MVNYTNFVSSVTMRRVVTSAVPFAVWRRNSLSPSQPAGATGTTQNVQFYSSSVASAPVACNHSAESIRFNDHRIAFEHSTNGELIRHLALLNFLRVPGVATAGSLLVRYCNPFVASYATRIISKHFSGASSLAEACEVAERLGKRGVGVILDYAAEVTGTDEWFETNEELMKRMVEQAARVTSSGNPPLCAVKLSGVCDTEALEKVSYAINFFHVIFGRGAGVYSPASKVQCYHQCDHLEFVKAGISKSKFEAELKEWFAFSDKEVDALWKSACALNCSQTEVLKSLAEEGIDVPPQKKSEPVISYFQFMDCLVGRLLDENSPPLKAPRPSALFKPMDFTPKWPSKENMHKLKRGLQRMHEVCCLASEKNVGLLMDAEATSIQPAIDYLTVLLQRQWNSNVAFPKKENDTHRTATISNTFQLYLRNSPDRLRIELIRSKLLNFRFGVKIVRGAYLCSESALAKERGIESPIQPTIDATHDAYNAAIDILVSRAPDVDVLVGTHNPESVKKAIEAVEKHDKKMLAASKDGKADTESDALKPSVARRHMMFGQLFGMADQITNTVVHHGFRAYKYLPFGPDELLVPYLVRRAEENSDMLSRNTNEIKLVWNELKRRMFRAQDV